MHRWTLGWALGLCAIAAAGCGGDSKPPAGALKGVSGQYFYLTVAPATGGTIASGDSAIACKSDGTGCGDATYHQTKFTWATPVVLTATALAGYQFDSWTGACTGTTNVCTLGTGSATEYSVVAVFKAVNAAPAVPVASLGRVYGYVKDGGVGAAGVTVKLGSATPVTTNANGAYVFEVAPGSYSLATVADKQYAAAAATTVTVPLADGLADPAGVCFLGGAKQGFWVPTAGQAIAGCLVKQNDIAVTRASTYLAPAAAPVIVTTVATIPTVMPAVVGFGADLSVGCGVGGVVTQAKDSYGKLVGFTPTLTPDGTGNYTFTTALLSDTAVTLVLATTTDGRPGIVSINQSQAGKLTYTLQCTLNGASATVTVPMVAAVNANLATALRGEPFTMASYKGAANGLPGITGPLWAAGAETTNATVGNPDGSSWRAHDAVQIPPGVVVILDGPAAGANWQFCGKAKDTYSATYNATCTDPTTLTDGKTPPSPLPVTPPTIYGNGTANAWFVANWKVGSTLYLTSDSLAATVNGFKGEPNIPVKPQIWGGWDLRSQAGVESCAGCHIAPGEKLADGTYELGPTEPTTGWLESKHSKAGIDGGSSLHGYTIQACGACHTTGWDTNLPATNVGFSAVLGTYTNDFLFEGSDATIWEADLAAKNPAAAALNNVQCGSCHGPTPNSPNHTASMSSKVCGTCHNGYDPQYEQWATSKHANLAGAIAEGPAHGRDQTHCGRCHFAQGYKLYAPAIASGNPDKLGNAAPAGAPSTALVTPILCADGPTDATKDTCLATQSTGLLTAQNIDAITCQTCHDPHSLEVRIKPADTANGMLLAAGFKIYNAGSGALCASCHNSRNGIVNAIAPNLNAGTVSVAGTPMQHNDATPLTSNKTNNFGGLGAPHEAAQADVYFAGNGYLLCNSGSASGACALPAGPNPHQVQIFFKDTCAECHVKRLSTATAGKPSNHTFTVDAGTCATCHGASSMLKDRQDLVAANLGKYLTSLKTVLNGAGITSVKCNGAVVDVTGQTITAVNVVSVTRVAGFDLTFSGAAGAQTQCTVDDVKAGTTPVLYTAGTDKVYGKVAKSMYNYFLINNDGSGGVHNIPFVDAMLSVMSDATKLDSSGLPK